MRLAADHDTARTAVSASTFAPQRERRRSRRPSSRSSKAGAVREGGIPYFWLIETDGGIVVHTYKLDFSDEVYQPTGTFADVVKVDEPWRIEVPVARLRPRHL